MKQVDKMPTSGQFVAVWEFNDRVWSCTYKWDDDGRLSQYYEDLESGGDGWVGVEIKNLAISQGREIVPAATFFVM